MTLKVVHDGQAPDQTREHCCLCFEKTNFWHLKTDVALCPYCARTAKLANLPTKREWCAGMKARFEVGV